MEKSRKHHHHSAKERQIAFDYLKEGKTAKEVAYLCGVSISTIRNWKRQANLRGSSYQNTTKPKYRKYSLETKCSAVKMYLSGRCATEVATLLGILYPGTVTTWARDPRYRGAIAMQDERRPAKNNKKRRQIKPIEKMTEQEELEFLRMENAILKKLTSLRSERQQLEK